MKAEDDVTKMAAQSLKQQACLAVFNAEDTANGIVLSCGACRGHVAWRLEGEKGKEATTTPPRPLVLCLVLSFKDEEMAEREAHLSAHTGWPIQ